MRVGEALIAEGLVTPAQLDAALRMQQNYGGRLASTLVELGYVDGDVATRTLAKLRKVPAALQKHFDAAERSVLSKVPKRVVEKYMAVPLGWAGEGTLICAMVEPTDLLAVEELRFLTGAKVVPGIAIELRVREALERWYGVAPRRAHGFVATGGAEGLLEIEVEQTGHVVPPSQTPPPHAAYRPPPSELDLTLEPPQPPSAPPRPPSEAPRSSPRRTHPPPLRRDDPDEEVRPSLRPQGGASIVPAERRDAASVETALAGVAEARGLEVRIESLLGWLRGTFEAGAVFEVRNDIAFCSRAFGPAVRPNNPPRIAVPLTQPSMLVLPYEARTTFFGTPPNDGAELHARIWTGLGTSAPREALALPIVIEDKVAAIVYAHPRKGERIPPSTLVDVANLCAAIGRGVRM